MADELGGLSFLPRPDRQYDGDGFFEQVLTGWKRFQFAQNFTDQTVRRRLRSLVRFADFCGKYPWEWTPPTRMTTSITSVAATSRLEQDGAYDSSTYAQQNRHPRRVATRIGLVG